MKLSEKIKLTLIFIAFFFIAFSMVNKAKAQVRVMPYQPDLLEKLIIKSDKKYSTTYKVVCNKINYYTNEIELSFIGKIHFSEYNRNGELRNSYSFPLSECKIYKSK